jgi:hypothetical protein
MTIGFRADATGNGILQVNGTDRLQIGTAGQLGIGGATYGTSGQVLTSNGAVAAPSWQAAASGFSNMSTAVHPTTVTNSSGTPMVNTGTGTFNFVVPAGVTKVKVTVVGGGGGSGGVSGDGISSGGGGGGAAIEIVSGLTPGGTVAVTVGAGGTAGSGAANGGTGGTSSFGAFCSATGGAGGFRGGQPTDYAVGGVGTGGDINVNGGGAGGAHIDILSSIGGCSLLAGHTNAGSPGVAAIAGNVNGGGARGVCGTAIGLAGAAGGRGIVIVEW